MWSRACWVSCRDALEVEIDVQSRTMNTLLTVVGARPQFIKAAALSTALARQEGRAVLRELLLHTGQHYDDEMSDVFFRQLRLPAPDFNLHVGSRTHGAQTGAMLAGIEEVCVANTPDAIVVYGDTNSTLAGALVGAKLKIPVIHIEAGLRSYDRAMPEEINRVVTDVVSSLLFCPSQRAADNLRREGIAAPVHVVGDVMLDVLKGVVDSGVLHDDVLRHHRLVERRFVLATIHRPENTDDPHRLRAIAEGLEQVAKCEPVLFPVHPRTLARFEQFGIELRGVAASKPLGYAELLSALRSCRKVVTDSGGLQKEAYFLRVPCVTVRDTTEWVETVEHGWNVLATADPERIAALTLSEEPLPRWQPLYGDGFAARAIIRHISEYLESSGPSK
jgi:UDP-GlcNAc3NAcA epimerase